MAALLGVAFGLASMGATYTLGLFVEPLTRDFHWSREEIMNVVLVMTLELIPAGLAAGWMTDRFGAFRLIAVSQVGLSACFIASVFSPTRSRPSTDGCLGRAANCRHLRLCS